MRFNFQNVRYGADEQQNFEIIIPKRKEAHGIVFIHGGAYLIGNKFQYPSFLPDYSENNVFATIDYRLVKPDNNVQQQCLKAKGRVRLRFCAQQINNPHRQRKQSHAGL